MQADPDAVDLFAGPGGWDLAAARLGLRVVGVEWHPAACATRAAAGHATIRADVAEYPPERFAGVEGLIASPPCPAFSQAGKREGVADIPRLISHLHSCADGWRAPSPEPWGHGTSPLVLEPLRWAWAIRPEWVALEQVPDVLPAWEATATALRAWGYSTWVGVLNSADYGVPQTRKRAILMASRVRSVQPPQPTHSDQRKSPDLFLQPWVSMAEALCWGMTEKVGGSGAAGRWQVRDSFGVPSDDYPGRQETRWKDDSEPSPVVTSKSIHWQRRWAHERPATTVVGSFCPDVIAAPGYRTTGDGPRQNAPGSIKVELWECGVLQDFPADYPWQGNKSQRGQQIGNAVPPLLAEHVLAAVAR